MSGLDFQIGLYLLGAAILGGLLGWLIRGWQSSRNLNQVGDEWQTQFDAATRQKNHLSAENESLKSSLEAEQATVQKHLHAAAKSRTELESLREKANTLSKNEFSLGAERDELNNKLSSHQNLLIAAKQRIMDLQSEFKKSQDFYKAQLESAIEQRMVLERKIDDSKSEQESLRNLLMSAKMEHESVSNLLASAQSRLQNLEALEQRVVSLEADNAELKQEAVLATREAESLQRDVAEMDELKVQNRELAHCLESMESSRKQYESDAHRYRSQYEQAEQESETMRVKLGDIEKNWAEMRHKNDNAREADIRQDAAPPAFGLDAPQGEADDLTEIVGVGKVFEETLHSLGVFHFRQIAAFGPAELARVNAELKEFKGRIEHDDWIGQAKELHFRKYGGTDEQ